MRRSDPPAVRFRSTLALTTVMVSLLVGCSSDGDGDRDGGADSDGTVTTTLPITESPDVDQVEGAPLVGQIRPAIAAVEADLGGSQEYFEVNADGRLVNVFVATDDGATATAYVYLDGELGPPAPPREVAGGLTFDAQALDFDPGRVLTQVAEELPDSTIERFVVLGAATGVVRYEVLVQSRQGGRLAVIVGLDGSVLAVETL